MTGRLVLPGTAAEAEWLDARRAGVTASEIAVLMGLSPYSSPYALYWQKTGDLTGPEDNDAMALGRALEGFVVDRFVDRYPDFYVHGNGRELFAHPDRPWQLATPDRLLNECRAEFDVTAACSCDDGWLAVLEAKTSASYDGWGEDGTDTIPVHYRCQVLWQMDVLGAQTAYVACLFLHSRKLRVYELTLDAAAQTDLTLMRVEARDFLTRIQLGDVPDVDWRPATSDALKRLHPAVRDCATVIPAKLAGKYRAACKALTVARQRKTLLENQIRGRMEDSRYAVTGHGPGTPDDLIATRQVYDLPAKTIERQACTVDKLVPAVPPKGETT